MWLYFLTVLLSCCGLALLQESDCTDSLPQCQNLIRQDTMMACYKKNLGDSGVSISKLCCVTCNSFKDPNAPEGCEYGDKTFGCSRQNCTNPPDEETRICCKTCQSNTETEMTSSMTTQAAPGGSTVSGTNVAQSTGSGAAQNTDTQTSAVSNAPETTTTTAESTPLSLATSTSIDATTAQSANTNPQGTSETVTSSGPAQQDTSATVSSDAPQQPTVTSQTATTNAPSQQETTAEAVTSEPCRDAGRCKNIRSHECYSSYTKERCCESCKMIAESKPKDCPYGDRLPLWCVLQILRSPRTICRTHDDLCCESCELVGPNANRSKVVLLQDKSIWKKEKNEEKRGKGKKGKGKGRDKGKKSKKEKRIRH